ncbi:MAG TPA: hypothetical protein VHJ20_06575 [Polyangia bacterium]|nr:hypothetical protein [Polyangia bacterium]
MSNSQRANPSKKPAQKGHGEDKHRPHAPNEATHEKNAGSKRGEDNSDEPFERRDDKDLDPVEPRSTADELSGADA